jgi:hypothetical protein
MMSRENKKPGRFFGPLVITGITAGVLYSAYKAIFKKPEYETTYTENDDFTTTEPKSVLHHKDDEKTKNVSEEEEKTESEDTHEPKKDQNNEPKNG